MNPQLLRLLACPECGGELALDGIVGDIVKQEPQSDVWNAELACSAGHEFPICDKIPRFVESESYAASFGVEWARFRDTLFTAEAGESFWRKTGWSPYDLHQQTVLDVGCGVGRYAAMCAPHATYTVALDMTGAVDVAQENFQKHTNYGHLVDFLQADIMHLPLKPATFDRIFAIGVLQHTPDPRAAFMHLVPLLKPGGEIAIHTKPRRRWSWIGDAWRLVTTRLPTRAQMRFAELRAWLEPLRVVPGFGRLWPGSQYADKEWRTLNNFDFYSPRYQWKRTFGQVVQWFLDAGLVDVQTGEASVSVKGVKRG